MAANAHVHTRGKVNHHRKKVVTQNGETPIVELAIKAFDAAERVRALGIMNSPNKYEDSKRAFVALAVAQEAANKAQAELEHAIKTHRKKVVT